METTGFTVDGPEFVKLKLRPDMIRDIRNAELVFRAAIQDMIEQFPTHLVGDLQPIVTEVPAKFIVGLLPFLQGLSDIRDQAEMFQKQLEKQQPKGPAKPH